MKNKVNRRKDVDMNKITIRKAAINIIIIMLIFLLFKPWFCVNPSVTDSVYGYRFLPVLIIPYGYLLLFIWLKKTNLLYKAAEAALLFIALIGGICLIRIQSIMMIGNDIDLYFSMNSTTIYFWLNLILICIEFILMAVQRTTES